VPSLKAITICFADQHYVEWEEHFSLLLHPLIQIIRHANLDYPELKGRVAIKYEGIGFVGLPEELEKAIGSCISSSDDGGPSLAFR
jgi:hypothetical protein